VLNVAPVPEDGAPPVAVQENATGAVPPVEVAVQEIAVPMVPVDGQLIATANVTLRLNAVVLMRPPAAVALIVIGYVPASVVALVVTLTCDVQERLHDVGLSVIVVPAG